MNLNEQNIIILLIGGIPGVGKSYLSNKIILEYKDMYEIKYLNFDLIENINKDNYLQYQQMRNDYLLKIQEMLDKQIKFVENKSLLIILDDNFFLKSMRKKIYNAIVDKIFQNNINNNNLINFYYLELLLKPNDINYCLKMNSKRNNIQKIPNDIIINMNNIFEYNCPYINKNQNIILHINNEDNINNLNVIKEIFKNKEKYIIKQKEKDSKEIKIIDKDKRAKLIDDIEDIIRKEINNIFKNNKYNKKKGKEISICKKEYMKMIINYIRNMEQNNNNNDANVNKSDLFKLFDECIVNNISNISQKENHIKILKEDFLNYLLEKQLITL